jgi:hypothetical protein
MALFPIPDAEAITGPIWWLLLPLLIWWLFSAVFRPFKLVGLRRRSTTNYAVYYRSASGESGSDLQHIDNGAGTDNRSEADYFSA